jgi:DNA integrity scanning protein DisA with diadenylate cyclase activity
MKHTRFSKHFYRLLQSAKALAVESELPSILLMMPTCNDWETAKKAADPIQIVVASVNKQHCASAPEYGVPVIELPVSDVPIHELISIALLSGVADDIFQQGSEVVVMYSAYTHDRVDSISLVQMDEHLGRLTSRDLQLIETKVPLDVLKAVVDLAVEIGREGREGKPVGTMFVVGDHKKVLKHSRPTGFDVVKGYKRTERSIFDSKVRESLKELAQMDGCFVISSDGVVEGTSRLIDTLPVEVALSHGLGSRHLAGAAISKNTNSLAIVVSESSGTVRIFQNGETSLTIGQGERRAFKWEGLGLEDVHHNN